MQAARLVGLIDLCGTHPGEVGSGELLRTRLFASAAVRAALEPSTALRSEVGLLLDELVDCFGDFVFIDVSVVINLELSQIEEAVGICRVSEPASTRCLDF